MSKSVGLLESFAVRLLRGGVRLYQLTVSPDHGVVRVFWPGGVCRFRPTCSQYLLDALAAQGLRGLSLGLRRIGRCHPFAPGGYDPPPHRRLP